MSVARITLTSGEDPNEGMHIDVVLNGATIKKGSEYFGVWFDKSDDTRCPFVLDTSGKIDYGAGYEDEDQFYDTNALDISIAEGAIINCSFDDETIPYTISKITTIGA